MVEAEEKTQEARHLPSALSCRDAILDAVANHAAPVFLDYDGTLTPIASSPDRARLPDGVRRVLQDVADRHTVAIVSGRDLENIRAMVGLDRIIYAGSHGLDIRGPMGLRFEHEAAKACIGDLDAAERLLASRLGPIEGTLLERKRFGLAVHYRNVAASHVDAIRRSVESARRAHAGLRCKVGKKVLELIPDVDWNKGAAVEWLIERLHAGGTKPSAVYIGDDLTDEDAFRRLRAGGYGIIVGGDRPTFARYRLDDTGEVVELLGFLAGRGVNRR